MFSTWLEFYVSDCGRRRPDDAAGNLATLLKVTLIPLNQKNRKANHFASGVVFSRIFIDVAFLRSHSFCVASVIGGGNSTDETLFEEEARGGGDDEGSGNASG